MIPVLKNNAMQIIVVLFILITSLQATAQGDYKISKKIPMKGDGKWDYLKIDEKSSRLFVSHADRVHVIDTKTDTEIKTINNLKGVHGIALAIDVNKGFISNGNNNTISVFDYSTLDSITTIKISGEKPDGILYDAFTKTVWAFCGKSNNAVVIDAVTNKVLQNVPVGKAPEFAVTDSKGLIYDNLEDENAISVIDPIKKNVIKKYLLETEKGPTGLDIDTKNNLLFSACAITKKLMVLDAANGEIIATLPISNKVDAVAYDPVEKLIFCSGGDGITTIIKQISKGKYEVLDSLVTQKGAKTMALDRGTHTLYFSTAEYVGDSKELQPNSFTLLVYRK